MLLCALIWKDFAHCVAAYEHAAPVFFRIDGALYAFLEEVYGEGGGAARYIYRLDDTATLVYIGFSSGC